MRSKTAWFSAVIAAFIQLIFSANVFAVPAPDISSFDIVQVCTEYQCVNTTSSPASISITGSSLLYVYVRQIGYAAYQSAVFNGSTVRSVSQTISEDGIVVGFLDTYDCGVAQSGLFTATARSTNTYELWTASINISINPVLTITKLGTGSGTITADTGTLSWNNNIGTGIYAANTPLILLPTASTGSSFNGWSGACTNSSGPCDITMDSNKAVSATFTVIPNAKIGDTYYGTLSNAYSAITSDGVIEAKDMTFVEDLTLDRDVSFTLAGGYADDYVSRTGFTTLNGILTISSGSMIVDSLIIL